MHAPLVNITILRYIIYKWESQEDGVQPCDCPTIKKNVCSIIKLYDHVPSVILSNKVYFSVTRMIMLISTPLQQLGDESM